MELHDNKCNDSSENIFLKFKFKFLKKVFKMFNMKYRIGKSFISLFKIFEENQLRIKHIF